MASNNPPEIPSFKKTDKDKEPKGGGAPLLGGGNSGGLRIRGLSGGPRTIIERLKQFKKKDLIFIASGLGVLFLAPLAEHFMMNPNADQSVLREGFDRKGNMFGDLSPYEGGSGGVAPGGMVGSGSDVITPLNVRDPSALIMGPGGTQQPPPSGSASGSVAPPPPPSTSTGGGWKDALAEGAKGAAHAAAPSAFKAPGSLAGAVRGLSALSGASYGGGPSYALPPISASNVPNRGGGRGSLAGVQAPAGYKGVAPRSNTSSGGGADALRAAADKAGNLFNRAGSAANNLDAAAKEAIPTGGIGAGGGGTSGGAADKGPGGSSSKDNKALGESLAYLIAKMRAEKELDLEFSKKKWREFEFPKMLVEETAKLGITNILGKGLFEPVGKALGDRIGCTLSPETCAAAAKGILCYSSENDNNPIKKVNSDDGKENWRCQGNSAVNGGTVQTLPCPGGCRYLPGTAGGAAAPPPSGGTITAPTTVQNLAGVRDTEFKAMQETFAARCDGPKKKPSETNWNDSACAVTQKLLEAGGQFKRTDEAIAGAQKQLIDSFKDSDYALQHMNDGLDAMDKAKAQWGTGADTTYGKGSAAAKELHTPNPPPDLKKVQTLLTEAQKAYTVGKTEYDKATNANVKEGKGAKPETDSARADLENAKAKVKLGWGGIQDVQTTVAQAEKLGTDDMGRDVFGNYNKDKFQGWLSDRKALLTKLDGNTDAVAGAAGPAAGENAIQRTEKVVAAVEWAYAATFDKPKPLNIPMSLDGAAEVNVSPEQGAYQASGMANTPASKITPDLAAPEKQDTLATNLKELGGDGVPTNAGALGTYTRSAEFARKARQFADDTRKKNAVDDAVK